MRLDEPDHFLDGGQFVLEDDGIEREIQLHALDATAACGLGQFVAREVGGGTGTHVEGVKPQIDGIGAGVERGLQGRHGTGWRQYFGPAHGATPRPIRPASSRTSP